MGALPTRIAAVIASCLVMFVVAKARSDTLELNDGTVHKGKVVADSPEVVGFKTEAGKLLMIRKTDIKELKKDPVQPAEPKEKKEVQKEEDAPKVPKAKAEPPPSTTIYRKWPFDAAEATRRQAETAKELGVNVEQEVDLGNGVKLTLVLIPAGEFVMGSTDAEIRAAITAQYHTHEAFDRSATKEAWFKTEKPPRRVTISRPFYLGKYEVTWEQWLVVVGNPNGRKPTEPKYPVEWVQCEHVQSFLAKATERAGGGRFALPTEAQWEYACRAGSDKRFCFGDDFASLPDYAWYAENSHRGAHPVGETKPNAWGLYDMHGNVEEWCAPPHSKANDDAAAEGAEAPALTGALRGGSWLCTSIMCRSACRHVDERIAKWRSLSIGCGFRVMLIPSTGAP